MTKKRSIRVGDLVKIVDPRPVVRVGYPRGVKDYSDEVEAKTGSLVDQAFSNIKAAWCTKLRERVIHELSYAAARADSFGGKERSLHFGPVEEDLRGVVATVVSRRAVQTGTYFPPSGGYDYYGDYDSEPGGLHPRQTHLLASVAGKEFPTTSLYLMSPCATCDAKVPRDAVDREGRLRTVHWISRDWDAEHPGYYARCYYCGNPFAEAAS